MNATGIRSVLVVAACACAIAATGCNNDSAKASDDKSKSSEKSANKDDKSTKDEAKKEGPLKVAVVAVYDEFTGDYDGKQAIYYPGLKTLVIAKGCKLDCSVKYYSDMFDKCAKATQLQIKAKDDAALKKGKQKVAIDLGEKGGGGTLTAGPYGDLEISEMTDDQISGKVSYGAEGDDSHAKGSFRAAVCKSEE